MFLKRKLSRRRRRLNTLKKTKKILEKDFEFSFQKPASMREKNM